MHIVIIGAGGIGGYFGARLIQAGAQVSFVARGAHGQAIAEHGLRVTSALGDALVRPHAVAATPAALAVALAAAGLAPADLIVFAVKLPDAEAAAATLAPLLHPGCIVLPLQNGVDVTELLGAQIGAEAVAAGVAYIATKVAGPGVIEHGGPFARLRFGALQPAQEPCLRAFLAACQGAGIDAEMPPDIRRTLWEKFVFLVGLSSLTALTRQPVGVIRAEPEMRHLLRQVMDEVCTLARAEGQALATDFADQQMALADSIPAHMKASMLHDLEAGRRLELPWLAAAVVRRSAGLGLQAPACRFVAAALTPYVNGAAGQGTA